MKYNDSECFTDTPCINISSWNDVFSLWTLYLCDITLLYLNIMQFYVDTTAERVDQLCNASIRGYRLTVHPRFYTFISIMKGTSFNFS